MSSELLQYPIAEIFSSFQGEGCWVGTPMVFIRLAGCVYQRDQCKTIDGQIFRCDTDFSVRNRLTIDEIIAHFATAPNHSRLGHFCITGGEPFIHDLKPLAKRLVEVFPEAMIHIETNGTRPIERPVRNCWVTCSPKLAFDERNFGIPDEWKFLVGAEASLRSIEQFISTADNFRAVPVWLQPIDTNTPATGENQLNFWKVFRWVESHQGWRVSIQTHKLVGVQ